MNKQAQTTVALILGIVLGSVATLLIPGFFSNPTAHQPYADEQGRQISSLSAADVEQLEAGRGWGLAKPAEFNGYPGPMHLLEFAGKLELNPAQRQAIDASFSTMRDKAKALGVKLIDAEAALDKAFIDQTITTAGLERLLAKAESIRSQLRAVHLSAHLEVTPLLNDEQKTRYASLRGYSSGHGSH